MALDYRLLTDAVSLIGLAAIAWIALKALGPKASKYGFFLAGLGLLALSIGVDLFAAAGGLTNEMAYASDVTKLAAIVCFLAGVLRLRGAFAEKPAGRRGR